MAMWVLSALSQRMQGDRIVVGLDTSESHEAEHSGTVPLPAFRVVEVALASGEFHGDPKGPMLFSFRCCCEYCSFFLRIRSCSFHCSRSLSFSAFSCFFR